MSRLVQLIQAQQSVLGVGRIALEPSSYLEKLGRPPQWIDKDALRHWLQGVLPVLDMVSELVPGEIDDHMATLIRVAVEDDKAWNALYGLISSLSSGWNLQAARECKSTGTLATKVGLDIDTVMEIIRMVMELIELLRK